LKWTSYVYKQKMPRYVDIWSVCQERPEDGITGIETCLHEVTYLKNSGVDGINNERKKIKTTGVLQRERYTDVLWNIVLFGLCEHGGQFTRCFGIQ
jgi:hypothetical protein